VLAAYVLGRWLGLTPEQPALCLRGFPGRLRVALSRFSDPPGLGRRQGAQRAARGTIREKNVTYNLCPTLRRAPHHLAFKVARGKKRNVHPRFAIKLIVHRRKQARTLRAHLLYPGPTTSNGCRARD
jgi:hypothetical protein